MQASPSKMSPERAAWLRRQLRLGEQQMCDDLNMLLGTNYGRTHTHEWFVKGRKGPSVTARLYLRIKLREFWHRRRDARLKTPERQAELLERVRFILEAGDSELVERFTNNLVICEQKLRAKTTKPIAIVI